MPSSPNNHHLDPFIEELREQYQPAKLQNWPLNLLRQGEWHIRGEIAAFERTFPQKDSVLEGDFRRFILDDAGQDKRSLTDDERHRLFRLKRELIGRINRAIGQREAEERNARLRFLDRVTNLVISIWALVREVKPY